MSAPPSERLPSLRTATPLDLPALQAFLQPFVDDGKLLPRTRRELRTLIKMAFIAEQEGHVVGFCALEIYSPKLAEIRSLAVHPVLRGHGIGKNLVQACIELARSLGVFEVMAITGSEEFFRSCGFDFTLPGEKKALFLQTREEFIPRDDPSSTSGG